MNYLNFETERLIIRPTIQGDAPFLLELMNTPKWIAFIGDRKIHNIADARKCVADKMTPQLERLGYSNYTVIRKSDEVMLGTCGLYDREGLDGVDIGFAFLPLYEGQGYALESAQKLMETAKQTWGLKQVGAITLEANKSSQRLLKRLGLEFRKMIRLADDAEELMYFSWDAEK
jgi:RimJ/RimL family protein N-acetyltransferase